MKSAAIASLLFASLALAAPLEKRAYATKTEIVVETVVVTTTIWDGQVPEPTVAAGSFYEKDPVAEDSDDEEEPAPTTVDNYVPPVNTNTPPSAVSAPSASHSAPSAPPPAPTTTSQTKPSSTYVAPPPPSSTQEPEAKPTTPAQSSGSSSGSASGQEHTGSYTLNYYKGNDGACGWPVKDTEMAVALSADTFGTATVDFMTGKTTNKWCGQMIEITNGDATVRAKIVDRCEGCTGDGLDATPALWEATTGGLGGAAGDRISSMSWKMVN